jgi:hypothetical protein
MSKIDKPDKLARTKVRNSTQEYLDIAEIKDNVVIMRDGTLRAVLLASSINFSLKSEDEQNAVISAYVSFINSIDFPLQVVIQSRELNIDSYIEFLKKKEKEQINQLLKIHTAEYIDYINELTSLGKIMNKRFYLVVSYNPLTDKRKGFFSLLAQSLKPATALKLREKTFNRYKEAIDRRIESVYSGLESIGIGIARLDTQALIELYYQSYNPEVANTQPLDDIEMLRVEKD